MWDVTSAIRFHIETLGELVLEVDPPILETVSEAAIPDARAATLRMICTPAGIPREDFIYAYEKA